MNRTKILGQRLFIWLCLCGLMPAMTQAAQASGFTDAASAELARVIGNCRTDEVVYPATFLTTAC